MNKITADFILETMAEKVRNKEAQFDAQFWLDSGQKLNLLLGEEQDLLFTLQQEVAKLKLMYFESQEKRNVSEAKMRVEASEEYRKMRIQEAKCKRIEEFIRLAKKCVDVASGF